ncbi:Acyl-[acyl-carrier-protein]--phospholipid O-acyltransferase [Alteripontixanthobacter maritimus]|uniref:Acyl-[acyl-carrier-protein]--phospholipid O-acyltransferase n=1 Tax=Alteripontixanthobacter maritimus TaxID=2161824 RepID=A0A369Q754_9SPHN|nr:MFS transporter [Alteripontixanthobacter maritimus]RDC60312.1 Acyl-[acyl-carrier-protein]--phospholipid O-acyltransferase [Alteripontixanthobacter maritimus]
MDQPSAPVGGVGGAGLHPASPDQTGPLLRSRRFLPLFFTQFLGAFNDNLYKTAMVLFVVYAIYNSESAEGTFSALASGLFILPFFLLSAIAGQLADNGDKARIIRRVKLLEIVLMIIGAAGLYLAWRGIAVNTIAIPLMLLALFLTGVQSAFFGPIKYAILPQHLRKDEVLAGTGWVEAGTYIAILAGTIIAGFIPVEWAAGAIIVVAVAGYFTGRQVPPAPAQQTPEPIDLHFIRASIDLVRKTMHDRRVFLAIIAISFFWTIGAVLFIHFPPLVKNVITGTKEVASLFLVIFSVGVAIGSVSVNALLKGTVSARYSPVSVIAMGLFVVLFYLLAMNWTPLPDDRLLSIPQFFSRPLAIPMMLSLLGIAVAGGMFVVPLYAFLTTFVPQTQTARTIAANNIVNSGAMVGGSLLVSLMTGLGVPITQQLLISAAMCLVSSYLGKLLLEAERQAEQPVGANAD